LNSSIDKGISEIVGVFTDPIIVFPGGWGDILPRWLKDAITMERMLENMKTSKEGEMAGTDAEACAYLMTVSLTQPMDSDWTQICRPSAIMGHKKGHYHRTLLDGWHKLLRGSRLTKE
jgi:hypothetical protein